MARSGYIALLVAAGTSLTGLGAASPAFAQFDQIFRGTPFESIFGGPPPAVMSHALRQVADWLPLALANQAIREPWLGIGDATGALLTTAAIAVVAMALAARRTAL